ncbi:MAG TPA: GntR family transcriptional regulator [Streptosporangiaceae bacterium]
MPLGYRAIAGELRARIASSQYAAGDRLPSEDALAAQFGVSRQTVNKALLVLRAEGLIRVERGIGTTVRELPMLTSQRIGRQQATRREAGSARGAFQAELAELGYETRSEVQVSRERAPGHIMQIFGFDDVPEGRSRKRDPQRQATGHMAVIRARKMYAGDVPVQLATGYYPADLADGTPIEDQDTGTGGTYSRLAELGHAPALFCERVTLRVASDDEAAFLRLDTEQRVYEVERVARDDRGRAVEVNVIVMPAHQWELVYEWPAG